ncbi:MAG: hypothetical protein H0V17_23385 [Deltaproteobacteria bacterium]|nr:hypothetical protein [Deltaproteobacteria bacterium]
MRTELIALALIACGSSPSSAPEPAPVRVADKAAPLASKEFFRVDVPAQPACTAGTACEARLVVTALGDYHVNDEYPFKLVADATPGVAVDGTGTFTPEGKTGTLAIVFRADKPGNAKIAGTFKLSVCNAQNCQIESPKIAFDVAIR